VIVSTRIATGDDSWGVGLAGQLRTEIVTETSLLDIRTTEDLDRKIIP